jgi:hypothetical protein
MEVLQIMNFSISEKIDNTIKKKIDTIRKKHSDKDSWTILIYLYSKDNYYIGYLYYAYTYRRLIHFQKEEDLYNILYQILWNEFLFTDISFDSIRIYFRSGTDEEIFICEISYKTIKKAHIIYNIK